MPILLVLLGATGLATFFAPSPDEAVVAPRPSQGSRQPMTLQNGNTVVEEPVLRLRPRGETAKTGLFEVAGQPVVVAPPPVAQTPQPVAPPLPFRVLGVYQDGEATTVFLDDKGQGTVVKVGDTLHNETYRIDAIDAEEIQMTYLPLQQKQVLALGDVP